MAFKLPHRAWWLKYMAILLALCTSLTYVQYTMQQPVWLGPISVVKSSIAFTVSDRTQFNVDKSGTSDKATVDNEDKYNINNLDDLDNSKENGKVDSDKNDKDDSNNSNKYDSHSKYEQKSDKDGKDNHSKVHTNGPDKKDKDKDNSYKGTSSDFKTNRTNQSNVKISKQNSSPATERPGFKLFSPAHSEIFQHKHFNCREMFAGNREEITRGVTVARIIAAQENNKTYDSTKPEIKNLIRVLETEGVNNRARDFRYLTPKWYLNATRNCSWFKQTRGYVTSALTQAEREFPIAFSMLVFKDVEMVERLLRAVYRPQNRYCIHVDAKADPEFFAAVQAVASCFRGSVRMSSRRVDVTWATFTVLEPELICMQDLWDMDGAHAQRKNRKWKYFINLTGQEFP
ncbi:hypothetical protein EGW08_020928 [Elysia chlorotica]|uniref:Protein xylosyltransferase n=1 Tax=Elysia chlorotica TaxID=188477 RepID=A0A3S1B3V0_ELYCH|nr:hypothetical protein EGW08_020928 [Elysia chlorotica]